jgi:excisionase family DNA binding protein
MEGWAKVKDAARYAGVSIRTFRDWLKAGLKHSRIGGVILIKYTNIDEYLSGFEVEENLINNLADSIVSDVLGAV